jgi:hypothetical protein
MHLTFFNNRKVLNEKLFNGQEDPENHVYLSGKKVYYDFLFLKVSRCKLKQKETILKLGNALKSKSKFVRKMSHGSAIFQVKDKCTSLVGS